MFKDDFNIIYVMYIELYAKSESTKPRLGFEIRSLRNFLQLTLMFLREL